MGTCSSVGWQTCAQDEQDVGVVATIMLLDARDDEFKERGRRPGPFFLLADCSYVQQA